MDKEAELSMLRWLVMGKSSFCFALPLNPSIGATCSKKKRDRKNRPSLPLAETLGEGSWPLVKIYQSLASSSFLGPMVPFHTFQ